MVSHSILRKPQPRGIGPVLAFASLSAAVFLVLGILGLSLARDSFRVRNTRNECQAIVQSLTEYFQKTRTYPESLNALFRNDPSKARWEKDYWGNDYSYKRTPDGKAFVLVSPGADGKLNTQDDLTFTSR